jgi:Putative transposase
MRASPWRARTGPGSKDRLTLRPDGTVLVTLKTPWRDGTTHLRFEPLALLERLASLTPRPRINALLYHGILAPHAAGRAAAVAYGRPTVGKRSHMHVRGVGVAPAPAPWRAVVGTAAPAVDPAALGATTPVPFGMPVAPLPGAAAPTPTAAEAVSSAPAPRPVRPPRWRWAELLQRVFAVDVLACPNCGGRMRVIATIDDPRIVRRILTHLGILGDVGPPPEPAAWQTA